LSFIQDKVDFKAIRHSRLKVAVDLLYGTSREYLDEILAENDIPLEEIHGFIDPYFGGVTPSCTEENLVELKALVTDKKCNLGIATDADGDRFGIVDEKGALVDQNQILALILNYLVSTKGWRGGVARSVATTHLVDRIARRFNLPLYRTPVGFKYIADLFLRGQIIFGGEESACLAVKDHLPEKDGIFAGLLVAEMLAISGKSLTELRTDLFREYGERMGTQKNISLTPEREKRLKKLLKTPPAKLDSRRVESAETIDGLKLDLADDDWLLLRRSGTEPLIRCYAEAGSKKEMRKLMSAGLELLG
jgi:phosphoglucomutase